MAKFVFSYRHPKDYDPAANTARMADWSAWFEGIGSNLVDFGNPVHGGSQIGNCGGDTKLGGFSVVSADDLESAIAVAKKCPGLDDGMGIEIGVVQET